jgi:WD40 repeat protein
MNSANPIKILFLASDPSDASRLRLQQEYRDIEERLQLAKQRERFLLNPRLSVRVRDITQAIFDFAPQIIHFSGHGTSTGALCFEDEIGKTQPVDSEALAELFELVADQVTCVVLNACYSETQAKAIADYIPYVIGMTQAIGDQAAIAFAVGFYKALAANRSIEEAYKFGRVEIRLQNIPEHLTPIFYNKKKVVLLESGLSNNEFSSEHPINLTQLSTSQSENPNNDSSSQIKVDIAQSAKSKAKIKTGMCVRTLFDHSGTVRSVAFSPNGQIIASGSIDRTIKIWEPENGELIHTISGHCSDIYSVAISPDSQILASGSSDGEIRLWQLSTGELLGILIGHKGAITSVAFSPDGQSLASSSTDKTIKIWNLSTKQVLYTLSGHADRVTSVAFSPDGQILASSSADKKIKLWNLHNAKLIRTLTGHSSVVNCVAFSPDGQTLATGSFDRTIKIWNLETGEPLYILTSRSLDVVHSLTFSPNGLMLVSGDNDKRIKIWKLGNGKVFRNLEGHSGWVSSVAISPDGQTLASGSADRTIKIWTVSSIPDFGNKPPSLKTQSQPVRIKLESPVDSPSSEQEIKDNESQFQEVLKIADTAWCKKYRTRLKGDQIVVLQAAWYRKNYDEIEYETNYSAEYLRRIVSSKFWKLFSEALGEKVSKQTFRSVMSQRLLKQASRRGSNMKQLQSKRSETSAPLPAVSQKVEQKLHSFEPSLSEPQAQNWKCVYTLTGHREGVNSIVISPNEEILASGGADTSVKVWSLRTGEEIRTLGGWFSKPHSKSVNSVAISPNGQILATASEDAKVKIWNLSTGKLLYSDLCEHSKSIYCVAISPDGQILASGSADSTIRLWNLGTGKKSDTLIGHLDAVNSVAISPDGQILASGSADKTIIIWNLRTGKTIDTLSTHSWPINTVAFSLDGQFLVSSSGNNTIRVMNLQTGELIRSFCGNSSAISPDRQILAGSFEKTIKIWDFHTGEQLSTLKGHSGSVKTITFSADGHTLVSGSYDKTIKIWQRR